MQTKDIKVGESYLYDTRSDWSGRTGRYGRIASVGKDEYSDRVTVVSAPKNGEVEVKEFPSYSPKRSTGKRTVKIRDLRRTWAEHQGLVESHLGYREESLKSKEGALETIKRVLPKKAFKNVPSGFTSEVYGDGSYSTEDRISTETFANLLEAAYAKGRKDEAAKA